VVAREECQPRRIRRVRNRRGPQRESEGFIVPLEVPGQHNPHRGKGPYFAHATEARKMRGLPSANNPGEHQDAAEEALP